MLFLDVCIRYVVERMDADLWEEVLNRENEFIRQLSVETLICKIC